MTIAFCGTLRKFQSEILEYQKKWTTDPTEATVSQLASFFGNNTYFISSSDTQVAALKAVVIGSGSPLSTKVIQVIDDFIKAPVREQFTLQPDVDQERWTQMSHEIRMSNSSRFRE